MNTFKVGGRITDSNGTPVANAQVRLISDLETLGAVPGAVVVAPETITWQRVVTGFAGQPWHAYAKFVAPTVAGLTYQDFRAQVVAWNPALIPAALAFQAELQYLMPQQDQKRVQVRWDRELSGYCGDRWHCWQTYVAGKVIGMTWPIFKAAVVEENPSLAASNFTFQAETCYRLPRNRRINAYEVVTTTTANGRYAIHGLPAGRYRIAVTQNGQTHQDEPVTLTADRVHNSTIHVVHLPLVMAETTLHFAAVKNGRFFLNGEPFKRFIGLNIQGLAHYGSGDIHEMAHAVDGDQEMQLRTAQNMGARIIRLFLAVKNRSAQEVGDRLAHLLRRAEVHAPGIRFIPALTNFYHNFGQFVQGDEGFYQQSGSHSRLSTAFFEGGYRQHYLPFVEAISTRFADEPRIFAWEPGNELMCAEKPAVFVEFMHHVASVLKQKAPKQLVTTGMLSTRHSDLLIHPQLRNALYQTPQIDFVTVHSYTQNGDAQDNADDLAVFQDIELAVNTNKPLVVEEAGIVRRSEEDHADRTPKLNHHLDRWFNERMTGGFLQWGFTADRRTGDGDKATGMVNGKHQDYHQLFAAYQQRANLFASE